MRIRLVAAVALAVTALGCGNDAEPVTPIEAPTTGQAPAITTREFVGSDGCVGFNSSALLGKPLSKATRLANASGCELRVTAVDGQPRALTDDLDPARIDVVVRNDTVASAKGPPR